MHLGATLASILSDRESNLDSKLPYGMAGSVHVLATVVLGVVPQVRA